MKRVGPPGVSPGLPSRGGILGLDDRPMKESTNEVRKTTWLVGCSVQLSYLSTLRSRERDLNPRHAECR